MSRTRSTAGAHPAGARPLRVLVAEADPAFAEEMGTVLDRDPLLEVVAVAKSASEAAETIERFALDVALIGEFAGRELGELAQSIGRSRRLAVIVLVRPDPEESRIREDIRAVAFLRRQSSAEKTLKGFLEVAAFAVAAQASREDADA